MQKARLKDAGSVSGSASSGGPTGAPGRGSGSTGSSTASGPTQTDPKRLAEFGQKSSFSEVRRFMLETTAISENGVVILILLRRPARAGDGAGFRRRLLGGPVFYLQFLQPSVSPLAVFKLLE